MLYPRFLGQTTEIFNVLRSRHSPASITCVALPDGEGAAGPRPSLSWREHSGLFRACWRFAHRQGVGRVLHVERTTSLRYLASVPTRPGGPHVRRLAPVSTPPPHPPALSRAISVLGQERGDGLTRPGVPGVPPTRQLAPGDGVA